MPPTETTEDRQAFPLEAKSAIDAPAQGTKHLAGRPKKSRDTDEASATPEPKQGPDIFTHEVQAAGKRVDQEIRQSPLDLRFVDEIARTGNDPKQKREEREEAEISHAGRHVLGVVAAALEKCANEDSHPWKTAR